MFLCFYSTFICLKNTQVFFSNHRSKLKLLQHFVFHWALFESIIIWHQIFSKIMIVSSWCRSRQRWFIWRRTSRPCSSYCSSRTIITVRDPKIRSSWWTTRTSDCIVLTLFFKHLPNRKIVWKYKTTTFLIPMFQWSTFLTTIKLFLAIKISFHKIQSLFFFVCNITKKLSRNTCRTLKLKTNLHDFLL